MKENRIDRELERVRAQIKTLQEKEKSLLEQKEAAQMARTMKTIERSRIPLPDIIAMIEAREAENRKILKGRDTQHEEETVLR